MPGKKPKYPPMETLQRMKLWCDRQERCQVEAKQKLATWGYYGHGADEIIVDLITAGYLNESRFAKAFVSGKFRIKGWGRNKIVRELKARKISAPCINDGLEEIEETEYIERTQYWIDRKSHQWRDLKPFERNGKVAAFVIGKGFESDLVWSLLKDD